VSTRTLPVEAALIRVEAVRLESILGHCEVNVTLYCTWRPSGLIIGLHGQVTDTSHHAQPAAVLNTRTYTGQRLLLAGWDGSVSTTPTSTTPTSVTHSPTTLWN